MKSWQDGKLVHCKYLSVVPYKALEKFSKALYGTTGDTYSARVFRPIMSSFFPQHENEAINWKLLFRAFYRYKSSHFAKTNNIFLKTMIWGLNPERMSYKIFQLVKY